MYEIFHFKAIIEKEFLIKCIDLLIFIICIEKREIKPCFRYEEVERFFPHPEAFESFEGTDFLNVLFVTFH